MNITSVCELLKVSGQTRAIVTIDTSGDDVVLIMNVPTGQNKAPNLANDKEMALRASLANPLRVICKVDEVDTLFEEEFAKFGTEFTANSKASNTQKSKPKAKPTKAKTVKPKEENKTVIADVDIPKDDNYDFFQNGSL